jgi:K+/H+ antiporter YhaU regulatory subunit KhtT
MAVENVLYGVAINKKSDRFQVESLKEYVLSLKQVIKNDEDDIINVNRMANIFLNDGQFENYGYLMERIRETELRIETCKECIRECEASLSDS